jgi:hypothetical protein
MRKRVGAVIAVLLAPALGLQAGDVKLGTCATSVGAWEFTSPARGRAVFAKEGDRYRALWITTFVDTNGRTQPEGVAADCTCQDATNKLVWKCRVAFAFEADQIGADQTFEWTVDGDTLNSWYVAPDGTRSATGLRRPK